jgi:3-oxoacyl-[acyl-carrier protein] reductase
MKASKFGRIINIISTSGRCRSRTWASRTRFAALASWAKTLATEGPHGITVNNILPGFTDTARLSELFSPGREAGKPSTT